MKRWALIESGEVVAIVEQELMPAVPGQWHPGDDAAIGWTFDGVEFSPPAPKPISKRITKLAFRNRFTGTEKVSLYERAKTSIAVQIYLDDLQAATFIDLAAEKTRNDVNSLEAFAIFDSPGRADEILNTPPTPDEMFTDGTN